MVGSNLNVKKHNMIIERWAGNPGSRDKRGATGFRWTVTYEKDGMFRVQGFADTHATARAAAEACLIERGIDLDWVPKFERKSTSAEVKPRWSRPRLS